MLPLTPCCNAESIYSHARSLLKAPISPLVLGVALMLSGNASAEPQIGLAMHGAPQEPKGFRHFPYVNPDAPKGGVFSLIGWGGVTTFNSLNNYILKGDAAQGLELLFDSLMVPAADEPDAVYGLVAESAELLASLTTTAPPKDREVEATKARAASRNFPIAVFSKVSVTSSRRTPWRWSGPVAPPWASSRRATRRWKSSRKGQSSTPR